MKKRTVRSLVSLVLCLLLVGGTFGLLPAAAEQRDLTLHTFGADALLAAADAVGTVNKYGEKIYTTYQDTLGIRSVGTGGYFLHSVHTRFQREDLWIDGHPGIVDGDTVRLTIRLAADDDFTSGDLMEILWIMTSPTTGDFQETRTVIPIMDDTYFEAPSSIDPVWGYEYKELVFDIPCEGELWDVPESRDDMATIRLTATGESSVSVFYISTRNLDTDQLLMEIDGPALGSFQGSDGKYEYVYPGDDISGIVSYMGLMEDVGSHRNDNEPYVHNAYGFNWTDNHANLFDSIGMEIPQAGDYVYDMRLKTTQALGSHDKCLATVWDGDTRLAQLRVTKEMVLAAGGRDGSYCHIRVPFTVDESRVGHRVTFQLQLFDTNDFCLSQVALLAEVDADAAAPEASRQVADAIDALTVTGDLAAVRQAYDGLDLFGQAWVGEDRAARLQALETERAAADALNEQIGSLPDPDSLTAETYAAVAEPLDAAERQARTFIRLYGEEDAAALITDAAKLTALRQAWDAVREQVAVQEVRDKIAAVGTVTEENWTEKKALLEEAEQALSALRVTYGDEAAAAVDTAALTAAREAYDVLAARPTYTLGDINADGSVNAADALLALQDSVRLITLEGDGMLAADVNGDQNINAADALLILQYSVRLISAFPAQN